jgi:hypothetical protein
MSESPAKLIVYLLLRDVGRVFLVRYRSSPNPKRSGWWIPAPELLHGEHPEEWGARVLPAPRGGNKLSY